MTLPEIHFDHPLGVFVCTHLARRCHTMPMLLVCKCCVVSMMQRSQCAHVLPVGCGPLRRPGLIAARNRARGVTSRPVCTSLLCVAGQWAGRRLLCVGPLLCAVGSIQRVSVWSALCLARHSGKWIGSRASRAASSSHQQNVLASQPNRMHTLRIDGAHSGTAFSCARDSCCWGRPHNGAHNS